jgi:hypothetical protein
VSLLNLQKDILCNGEIFLARQGKVQVRWGSEDKDGVVIAELSNLRRRDPEAFLKRVFARNYGCGSVGFKIFAGQNDAMLDSLILDESVRKVVLMRRNVLAVYSSALIARETGTRTSRDSVLDARPQVGFREGGFSRYCERYLSYYRKVFSALNDTGQPFHLINYDQVNDPWHFASLVNFIGAKLTDANPKAQLVKLNSSDIVSRFSNPDTVEAFLQRHRLNGWQYEIETSLDPFGTAEKSAGAAHMHEVEAEPSGELE